MKDYVLHIASWYPNKDYPNEGSFIKKQVNELSKIQNAVVIAVIEYDGDKVLLESEKGRNLEEHLLYIPKVRWKHFYYYYNLWKLFLKIKKEKGLPLFIHVHVMFRVVLIGWFINLLYKTPYIITEHFTVYTKESTHPKRLTIRKLTKLFSKRAQRIIAISDYLTTCLIALGFSNVETVYNLVDTEIFRPSNREIKSGDPLRLLHISNLKEGQKNVTGIIEAFEKVSKSVDLTLTIIGSDDVRLEGLKASNANPKLAYFSSMPSEKLAELMSRHDVLVMFSNYETFSLVVAEAKACNLYIIATNVGGPKELVTSDREGILVEPGNVMQLSNAMIVSYKNRNTLFNKKTNDLTQKYGKQRFFTQMTSIYKNVIHDKL